MTDSWLIVGVVGIGTIAIKAAGPVLLGGRPLPARLGSVVALLAPALLAALVATAAFGSDGRLVVDARAAALAGAAGAVALRAPVLLVVVLAAATAAIIRILAPG